MWVLQVIQIIREDATVFFNLLEPQSTVQVFYTNAHVPWPWLHHTWSTLTIYNALLALHLTVVDVLILVRVYKTPNRAASSVFSEKCTTQWGSTSGSTSHPSPKTPGYSQVHVHTWTCTCSARLVVFMNAVCLNIHVHCQTRPGCGSSVSTSRSTPSTTRLKTPSRAKRMRRLWPKGAHFKLVSAASVYLLDNDEKWY